MEDFKEYILELDTFYKLNFRTLLDIIEENDIKIISCELNHCVGLATIYGLYIDISKLSDPRVPIDFNYFIILHEIAHIKRIKKLGNQMIIDKLSRTDFDHFFEGIIEEEVFADRWASLMYLKLNGQTFPRYMTQQLDLNENQVKYKDYARRLFGVVDNSEENYKELMKTFVLS